MRSRGGPCSSISTRKGPVAAPRPVTGRAAPYVADTDANDQASSRRTCRRTRARRPGRRVRCINKRSSVRPQVGPGGREHDRDADTDRGSLPVPPPAHPLRQDAADDRMGRGDSSPAALLGLCCSITDRQKEGSRVAQSALGLVTARFCPFTLDAVQRLGRWRRRERWDPWAVRERDATAEAQLADSDLVLTVPSRVSDVAAGTGSDPSGCALLAVPWR